MDSAIEWQSEFAPERHFYFRIDGSWMVVEVEQSESYSVSFKGKVTPVLLRFGYSTQLSLRQPAAMKIT